MGDIQNQIFTENRRETAITIAADRIPPMDWDRKLEDTADRIANYIKDGNSRGPEKDRCEMCGANMSEHYVLRAHTMGGLQPNDRPIGWGCPPHKGLVMNEGVIVHG